MIPRAMDSLEHVETVMLIEELFEVRIPGKDAEQFGSPRDIADWLDSYLTGQNPSKKARAFLQGLAKLYDRPELLMDLDGPWRREQIAAIVRALYADEDKQWLQMRVREIERERKREQQKIEK